MSIPKEFYDMVCTDIEKLSEYDKLSEQERIDLHLEIDGCYQACIQNWCHGMRRCHRDGDRVIYAYLDNDPRAVQSNLKLMKAKLESYKLEMNAIAPSNNYSTQVNVTTNVNLNITFEQARMQINEMTSLTSKETQEALARVSEIQEISKSSESKKSKWEKIKPVLVWLADKSYDLGKTILPLLLKIQE